MKFTRPTHGDQCPVCADVCATLDGVLTALDGIADMVPPQVDAPNLVRAHVMAAALGWAARLLLANGFDVATIIEALEQMSAHGALEPRETPTTRH